MYEWNEKINNDEEFQEIIADIATNDTVLQMKNFRQHYDTNCFEHCMHVAFYSYLLCKKYHLDYHAAARAGMLHDLFLYDWRIKDSSRKGLHGFTHPKCALTNALALFPLNKKEQDIIVKHMWPLTIKFPKYKESFIVTFVDKYCAIAESYSVYFRKIFNKKYCRYAYLFLSLWIARII